MTEDNYSVYSDRLRLVFLLDACQAADLAPVPIRRFHALAFLANILAPVWSERSFDGKILKRSGGPYYPDLQYELDRLVGLGIVTTHGVGHVKDQGRWRLDGAFALSETRARPIIEWASAFVGERATIGFFRRLAFAVSRLAFPIEDIVTLDVTWADRRTGTGDVIDFSEWQVANYSAAAATYFENVSPHGIKMSRGDKLQLYMRLLERRAHASS